MRARQLRLEQLAQHAHRSLQCRRVERLAPERRADQQPRVLELETSLIEAGKARRRRDDAVPPASRQLDRLGQRRREEREVRELPEPGVAVGYWYQAADGARSEPFVIHSPNIPSLTHDVDCWS